MSVTQVQCPNCGVTLRPAGPGPAGLTLQCPRCATLIDVPPAGEASAVRKPGVRVAPGARPRVVAAETAPVAKKGGRGLVLLLAGLAAGVLLACCGVTAGLGLLVAFRSSTPLAGSTAGPLNDTPEAFIRNRNRLLSDLVDLLSGVQDQASAQRAGVKLKNDLGPRIQQLKRRAPVLGTITPDQQQLLEIQHGGETQTARIRLQIELHRVKDVPGGQEVIQELRGQFRGWTTMQLLVDIAA